MPWTQDSTTPIDCNQKEGGGAKGHRGVRSNNDKSPGHEKVQDTKQAWLGETKKQPPPTQTGERTK